MYLSKQNFLISDKLYKVYADMPTQDTDNVGHKLPVQILNLARKIPKKVNIPLHI